MQENNKAKRVRLKYWNFYSSLFFTFLSLVGYFLGKYYIPFPIISTNATNNQKLFSNFFDVHLLLEMTAGKVFNFYNWKNFFGSRKNLNQSREQANKIKTKVLKVLKPNFIAAIGIYRNWEFIKHSYHLIFINYLAYFAANCLLEIIMRLIDDYGVCNGFGLILFTEIIPTDWLMPIFSIKPLQFLVRDNKGALSRNFYLTFCLLFFSTVFFVYFSNLKWEVPIETNSIHFNDNYLLDNYHPKFGFRLNFGLIGIIEISWIINLIYNFFNAIPARSLGELFVKYFQSSNDSLRFSVRSPIFYKSFIAVSLSKSLFANFFANCLADGSKFIYSLTTFLFIILFFNWFSIYNDRIKPSEVADDLKKRGIYFDGISAGKRTEQLISSIVNRLVLMWSVFILIFNFLFDQTFWMLNDGLINPSRMSLSRDRRFSFFSWFSAIGLGVDLFRQIKTKYEYIQSYE